MPANLENSAVATGLEKVSFHFNPKERQCQRMLKLPHNCTHLTPMLKILQARLQQLPDVPGDLEKTEEPEIKLPTSVGSLKKQESSRKSTSALLITPKPLTVWITTNGKTLQAMGIPDHWRRKWQSTPVFLPGESRGQRSLVGCCP